MSSSIDTALSALAAASRRIEVAGNNIANQNSTTTQVDGVTTQKPYLPQDIVQISEAGGGVRTQQRTQTNPTQTLYSPSNPDADENGQVESPNVDVATQLVNARIATYDFKAALKVIQTQHNVEQSLLDILS
ncbi:MAG: hypothetical protein EBR02_05795 [Alphaproteobacteria bacterium]|nr:hypothetical protein [Alphaproteobacteria bacterium]